MEYCEGHIGYGVDSQGRCIFCGKYRQSRAEEDSDIPTRWRVKQEIPYKIDKGIDLNSINDNEVSICSQCGRKTLVRVKLDWYECVACKACGGTKDEVKFMGQRIVNKKKNISVVSYLSSWFKIK